MRSNRIAGGTRALGQRAELRLGAEISDTLAVPAFALVGARPGPRVSVVAGVRGHELAAALAVHELGRTLPPGRLAGSVVLVPFARPRGLPSRTGRPVAPLLLPGDAGGDARARLALALHAELIVPAALVLVLEAPRPGQVSPLVAAGPLGQPHVRRLARAAGPALLLDDDAPAGSFVRVAVEHGRPALALRMGSADPHADADALVAGTRGVLAALGLLREPGRRRPTPPTARAPRIVLAPASGRVDRLLAPGTFVEAGAAIGEIVDLVSGAAVSVRAPVTGLLVERLGAPLVRERQRLALLGRCREAPAAMTAPALPKRRVGWVERVALPGLGLAVKAKIDTGARTSALHVLAVRTLRKARGRRRPRVAIELPGPGGRGRRSVELAVREYVEVRDTSGRTERRPVVETTLVLGAIRRRIRLTLTNRGDMVYPLLVGRTAVGPDVLVDPSLRFLLPAPEAPETPGLEGPDAGGGEEI